MADDRNPAIETVIPLVQKRSRSHLIAIAVLVLAWLLAMYYRNELRAMWWSYRVTVVESTEEQDYYVVRLASLKDTALVGMPRIVADSRPEIRSAGIRILHFCESSQANAWLIDLLDDASDEVASHATVELVRRGKGDSAIDRLGQMIAQNEPHRIRSAAAALSRIGGTEAEALLINALKRKPDADACAQIIDSLALLECRRAIRLIEAHADDRRPITILPASYRAAQAAIKHLRAELLARQTDPNGLLATIQIEPTVAAVAQRALQLLAPKAPTAPAQP